MTEQEPAGPARRSARDYAATLTLAASLLALGVGWTWRDVTHASAAPSSAVAAASTLPALTTPVTSYATIVDQVAPAVVTIRTAATFVASPRSRQRSPFEQYFGQEERTPRRGQRYREEGLGSGIIVRPDGYILTNHHVIDNVDQIQVELPDKRVFDAKVIGDDAPSDLAVVKIDATGLRPLAVADSDRARVGDVVLAVGNPLGVGQTVTSGIISAKGRTTGASAQGYEDFIQTDAPINEGNSGGALVNLQGQLVGINSQIVTPTGGNVGLGFAIPSNMAHSVMDQLIAHGRVRRAKLGVTVQPVTADVASALKLAEIRGALVNSVEPDSPGARAGLQAGDVILEVQGRNVADGNDLRNAVSSSEPGTSITLQIVRDGKPLSIAAKVVELQ